VSDWADSALGELEDAQDSLDEEADSLEEAVEQLTGAAGAIASTLASGTATVVDVARLDPELADALRDSSTCQQLREETG
jgi:ABC-type transporter Mla subunit MlaD